MPTFFGQQTTNSTDLHAGDRFIRSGSSYACPGSGNQNIQELSFQCHMNNAGSGQKVRMGIYTTAGALVAEGTAAITIVGNTLAWQGHMTQADVKAAGGVSPGVLVGGTSYYIGCYSTGGTDYVYYGDDNGAGTQDQFVDDINYTTGMPATLPGMSGLGYAMCVRCSVDPASSGTPITATFTDPLNRQVERLP